MKKSVFLLVGVFVIFLISAVLYQRHIRFQFADRIAALETDLEIRNKNILDIKNELERARAVIARPAIKVDAPSLPVPRKSPIADIARNVEMRAVYLKRSFLDLEVNVRPFFEKNNIPEELWVRYKSIIGESDQVILDAEAEGYKNGLNDKEINAIIGKFHADLRANLIASLGQDLYNKLIAFNGEQQLRSFAGDFAGKLVLSHEPLNQDQVEQYLGFLQENKASFTRAQNGYIIPDEQFDKLSSILTPSQLALLRAQQDLVAANRQLAGFQKK